MNRVLLAAAVAAVLATLGPSSAQARELKAMLLTPARGWVFEWSSPDTGNHGLTEAVFEERDGKLVVKLNMVAEGAVPTALRNCERDVTLASDEIRLDGCRDTGVVLVLDPNDATYPLKTMKRTNNGYLWKGKAK